MTSKAQVEHLINEMFRRISNDGVEPVGELFTDDGFYDGVYNPIISVGPETITKVFRDVIPTALHPFRQWPIMIGHVDGGDSAVVEYLSHGTATRDGSTYENKYCGVVHFRDDKISAFYEYFNPVKFNAAVGPEFQDVVDRVFPDGLTVKPSNDAPWMSDHQDEPAADRP